MSVCVSCSKQCFEGDSVTCDICKKYVHINCAGLSKNEADCLRSKRRKIHFYCDRCDIVDTVLKLRDQVESLKAKTDAGLSRDNVISDNNGFSFEEALAEFEDRNARATNLILYNLPESKAEDEEERKKDDMERCMNTVASQRSDSYNVVASRRLGKYNDGKIRPIKICFASREDMINVLKAYKTKNNLYLNRDLTPRQRSISFKIRQEYRERIKNGESSIVIKYFNGMPKIIKIHNVKNM